MHYEIDFGVGKHIVRLTMWHHKSRVLIGRHLIFCSWRHQRAVTHLENVRQFDTRRGKKQVFKLSHRQPAKRRQIKDYSSSWRHCIASKHERWSNYSKSAKFFKKLSFINKRLRYCLKLSTHLLREVLSIKDYAAKTDGCLEIVGDCILLKRTYSFFFKYNVKWGSQEENGVIFLYVQLKTVSVKL